MKTKFNIGEVVIYQKKIGRISPDFMQLIIGNDYATISDDILPVKLTGEILKKVGFEKKNIKKDITVPNDYSYYVYKLTVKRKGYSVIYFLDIIPKYRMTTLKFFGGSVYDEQEETIELPHIKHLHELQRAFPVLFGIELDVSKLFEVSNDKA